MNPLAVSGMLVGAGLYLFSTHPSQRAYTSLGIAMAAFNSGLLIGRGWL